MFIDDGFIAGMQPQDAGSISYHYFIGFLLVVPVALLERIPCYAKLATLASTDNLSAAVDDFGVSVGQWLTNCCQSTVQGVVCVCIEAGRRSFGEP